MAKPLTTQILIEITHYKPLPAKTPITDIVAQRVYGYLYANGVEAGVAAKLWLEAADVVVSAEVTEVADA